MIHKHPQLLTPPPLRSSVTATMELLSIHTHTQNKAAAVERKEE